MFKLLFGLILINNLKLVFNQEMANETGTDANTYPPLVANISVTAYYEENDLNNLIRLNITWIEFDDLNINETKILICNKEKSGGACAHFFEKLNYPLNKQYVICPDPFVFTPEIEFQPGCVYNIELESDQDLSRRNSITYQIPECVGEYCDCAKFGPTSEITDISPKGDDQFLIEWDPGSLSPTNQPYHIVDVEYVLHGKNTTDTYYANVDIVENNLLDNYSIIRTHQLPKGQDYILAGYFINNFQCKTSSWREFSVNETNYYIEIVCIAIIIIIIIGLKCKQIQKYGAKLINILPSRYDQFVGNESATIPLAQHDGAPNHIPMQINVQYTPVEFVNSEFDCYEFPINKLQIKKTLGNGAFGQVFLGKAFEIDGVNTFTTVAVKTCSDTSKEAVDDFVAEIGIFKKIQQYPQHPNIVKLLGCCTIDQSLMMIMEYVPCGDLKQYLIDLREQWLKKKNTRIFFPENSDSSYIVPESPTTPISITSSNLPPTPQTNTTSLDQQSPSIPERGQLEKLLDTVELQNFALQIAKGMAHLETIPIVHRDLAARNILINQNKILKISDFGLSRYGTYINYKLKKPLPLRWMSIEAILEQKYTNKSDIWSYGVLLWEIGTLGALPYEKVIDNFLINYLQIGKRLERPEICTNQLYDLMLQCWATDPDDRPSFAELIHLLGDKKTIYIDFSQLNPLYVFPASEIVEH